MIEKNKIYNSDCLEFMRGLPDDFVDCCVTSPPYFQLRDYGIEGQIGLEETLDLYIQKITDVFSEVRRILKPVGTLWLNLGDTYNAGRNGGHPGGKKQWKDSRHAKQSGANIHGLKPKDLAGIPWRIAFALQADGWYLRCDIIWDKMKITIIFVIYTKYIVIIIINYSNTFLSFEYM